jgi:glutathione S-transferase
MTPLQQIVNIPSSVLASQIRGWRGTLAFRPSAKQPERPLELYDLENSPPCRLVREALTELDLDALIYPCPEGGQRFRSRLVELGGGPSLPLLLDPNVDRALRGPDEIIAHLRETYGARRRSRPISAAEMARSRLASLARGGRGLSARPSRAPERPLSLYSFESSPYSRPVRETLAELELPYLLHNTGKARWEDMGQPWVRRTFFPNLPVEGRNRLRLLERVGRVQLPYLIDPNTGAEMFESVEINAYLERTYAA